MERPGQREKSHEGDGLRDELDDQHRTLTLGMYVPASKQLVWTGNATKTIDPKGSQEKKRKESEQSDGETVKEFSTRVILAPTIS